MSNSTAGCRVTQSGELGMSAVITDVAVPSVAESGYGVRGKPGLLRGRGEGIQPSLCMDGYSARQAAHSGSSPYVQTSNHGSGWPAA